MHGLMFISTFCWATNIIAGKEALRGFGALALAQLRVSSAAMIYGGLFLALRPPSMLRLPRREWFFLGAVALFGITLNQLFFIGGLARTSAAHSGLIVALGPVMVLVLSSLKHMEAPTVLKAVGMLISFCGVAILTMGQGGRSNGAHWQGDLLAVAGSAVFAYYTILGKEAVDRYDALTLNTIIFVMGSVLMLPFTTRQLLTVGWRSMPPAAWWGLAYMAVLGSVLAYLLFAFVLTELTPSRVAAFNYLQPLIAIGLGVWLLGERITSSLVAGGALILAGLYLTEREPNVSSAQHYD